MFTLLCIRYEHVFQVNCCNKNCNISQRFTFIHVMTQSTIILLSKPMKRFDNLKTPTPSLLIVLASSDFSWLISWCIYLNSFSFIGGSWKITNNIDWLFIYHYYYFSFIQYEPISNKCNSYSLFIQNYGGFKNAWFLWN